MVGSMQKSKLKAGRPTRREHKKIRSIVESYYNVSMTYQQIAEETGYNNKTISKYLSPLYKAASEERMKRLREKWKKEFSLKT